MMETNAMNEQRIAVYPGSFDPITLGHLNIIKRASHIFDKVIVCIMVNSEKHGLFAPEERAELVRRAVERFPTVEVDCSQELLSEYAMRKGAHVVVKGLRAMSDFEKEFQMAHINHRLNPDLDTMFLTSSEKYTFLSSSVVKELGSYGADLHEFVPREIIGDIERKIKERQAGQGNPSC